MDYRYLGRSGLQVSPLCLGAMMFGGETDASTSTRIIDKAFEQGINFIDTADVYYAGCSEEIVGRAIATLQLGNDDEKFVDSLVRPGHASTAGYTDPGYPVEGRKLV